jgi:Uma2 family endonuclease
MSEAAPRYEPPRFTYGDYLQWSGAERWELIDGDAFDMSPAPRIVHQRVVGELFKQLSLQLEGHPCEAFVAPVDVRLPDHDDQADEDIKNVVQPDVLVVCDPDKIDEAGVRGAPDFIAEVLSASTAARDRRLKAELYAKHGVREYWIVDPVARQVEIFRLGEDGLWLAPERRGAEGILSVGSVPGASVDLAALFPPAGGAKKA